MGMLLVLLWSLPVLAVGLFIAGGLMLVAPPDYPSRKRWAVGCAGFLFLPGVAAFLIGMAELFKR